MVTGPYLNEKISRCKYAWECNVYIGLAIDVPSKVSRRRIRDRRPCPEIACATEKGDRDGVRIESVNVAPSDGEEGTLINVDNMICLC